MTRRPSCTLALGTVAVFAPVALAAPTFYGPTPYLSVADGPLISPILEDFEDGALNLPGVSISSGQVIFPGALTDSVDADDGALDGLGAAGRSLLLTAGALTVTFEPVGLGGYPTHAGVVWTDVGNNTGTFGFAPVTFEAFAPGGASLGTVGPFTLGDGAVTGATAEDRFFGVRDPNGIAAITISTPTSDDWEIDHIQYVIPEPAAAALAVGILAIVPLGRRGRR